MDSKLPSSSAPEKDADFPRGVRFVKLSRYEFVFLCLFGAVATVFCLALLGVTYIIARFFWAIAFA